MPTLPSFDCYSALEVSKNATESDIHKAYKRLALVHHPDKNPDDEGATARFQQVNTAYATLKDVGLRRRYNSSTSTSSSTAPSAPFPNQSTGPSFWGFESDDGDDGDDNDSYSTFAGHFDFMFFDDLLFRLFYLGVPRSCSEADKQRDTNELFAKRVRVEKVARDTEAKARQEEKVALKKAKDELKMKERELREAANRAHHESEWARIGVTTQAEKQTSCFHAEFWTKEKQTKKVKCGKCGQKRSMLAFKCQICALSVCQLCRDTFAEERKKLTTK
ncbi:hypothetical protein BGZ60DRAFT_387219 [Tricladium varicosporioides]|nr:hypothetical protein BGZ60DRAFT_387219 [Hymenoscyphus varicosporioides]